MTAQNEPTGITPGWSLHPGALLRQVLEARGIRQSELAERTGLTPKHVNQVVKEIIGISGDVALLLERALGIDAEFWIRADADYQAYSSRERAKASLAEYTTWANAFDLPTLTRHGVTSQNDDPVHRVDKILKFFGVASPEAFEQTWQRPRVSFRRSQAFAVLEQNTALWLRLVECSAEQAEVSRLRVSTLRSAARAIRGMTNLTITDGFATARDALAEAGVVLTFVRQVPGTRVCGATWWLGADRPVIGLTERNRKPDIFWFTLLHEIGHIALHPRRTTFLDLEGNPDDAPEQEANSFAGEMLFPGNARDLIARATTRQQLLLLSAKLGIGTAIVAGQHGHLTGRWAVGGSLRGTITDKDVNQLETICPIRLHG
ncbi:ImmA/IrrE family metallo-endopeptidase [Nonomuraea sp. NPDC003707]